MKKDTKIPQHDHMPCWYEISLKSDLVVGIRLHRSVLNEFQNVPWGSGDTIIEDLIKKYEQLTSFTSPSERSWGFDNVFVLTKSDHPDWICWEFTLPDIQAEFKNKDFPKTHIQIRATLMIFCMLARFAEIENISDIGVKQLIIIDHINLPAHDRFGSGSLSAILTPQVMPWIAKQPEGHVKEIQQSMRVAHEYMWSGGSRSERFGARISHPKWIYFDVPGDACDLSPDNNSHNDLNQGYTLVPHNVDSGVQQLAFVVGLAKLHELVRIDGF